MAVDIPEHVVGQKPDNPTPGGKQFAMHDVQIWVEAYRAYKNAVKEEKAQALQQSRQPRTIGFTEPLHAHPLCTVQDLAAAIDDKRVLVPKVTLQTAERILVKKMGWRAEDIAAVNAAVKRSPTVVAKEYTWDSVQGSAYGEIWDMLEQRCPEFFSSIYESGNPLDMEDKRVDIFEDGRQLAALRALSTRLAARGAELLYHTYDYHLSLAAPHVIGDSSTRARAVGYVSTPAATIEPYWTYNLAPKDMMALREEDKKARFTVNHVKKQRKIELNNAARLRQPPSHGTVKNITPQRRT